MLRGRDWVVLRNSPTRPRGPVSLAAPPHARRCASVLSELWHAEPGCGSNVFEVQFSPQERGRTEVQGHHADDESSGCRVEYASAGCCGAASGPRAAPSGGGGAVHPEQAEGNDGRRRADGGSHARPAVGGRSASRAAGRFPPRTLFRGRRGIGVRATGPAAGREPARRNGRSGLERFSGPAAL